MFARRTGTSGRERVNGSCDFERKGCVQRDLDLNCVS